MKTSTWGFAILLVWVLFTTVSSANPLRLDDDEDPDPKGGCICTIPSTQQSWCTYTTEFWCKIYSSRQAPCRWSPKPCE